VDELVKLLLLHY